MSKFLYNYTSIVLAFFAVITFVEGVFFSDIGMLSLAAFMVWGSLFLRSIGMKQRNVILIFFLLSFFLFLLSRVLVRWILNQEVYQPFDPQTMVMMYCCLIVSLVGMWFGSSQKYHFKIGRIGYQDYSYETSTPKYDMHLIRSIAFVFTIVSGFATLLTVLEQVAFWDISGAGGDLRVSFGSTLPGIVLRLSSVYVLMLCIYLATMPTKKATMIVFLQYLVCSALKMVYGSRSDFVLGLMFIVVYFKDSNESLWFGKKELLFTIISIPLLVVLVVFVGYYRVHTTFEFSGLYDTFLDFFESQGGSIDIIGYTKIYEDKLNQPLLYMFDKSYEFIVTNPVSRIFTGQTAHAANTVERAIYGTSLGQSLYYHMNRASYLAGFGGGSSYVAEIWIGYGYIGLFVWNFILARVILKIKTYKFNRLIPSVVILVFIQSLFFMPRAGFDGFVGEFLSATHLFMVFAMWLIYKIIKSKRAYDPMQ